MTLGLALGNADQIIVAVDRRVTCGKAVIEDGTSKIGHAVCDDASFLYCFTGLASDGRGFVTSRWLPVALYNAAQRTSHRYLDIAPAFANEAHATFDSLRNMRAQDRRLTIRLTGYVETGQIVSSLISNFRDFDNSIDHAGARVGRLRAQ